MSMPEGDELMSQLVGNVELETIPVHAVSTCKQTTAANGRLTSIFLFISHNNLAQISMTMLISVEANDN